MNSSILKRYVRIDRDPIGCVVAVKEGDDVKVGWSLCNKKDQFNKFMAEKIALGRAQHNADSVGSVPQRLQKEMYEAVEYMRNRAKRYWRLM